MKKIFVFLLSIISLVSFASVSMAGSTLLNCSDLDSVSYSGHQSTGPWRVHVTSGGKFYNKTFHGEMSDAFHMAKSLTKCDRVLFHFQNTSSPVAYNVTTVQIFLKTLN